MRDDSSSAEQLREAFRGMAGDKVRAESGSWAKSLVVSYGIVYVLNVWCC